MKWSKLFKAVGLITFSACLLTSVNVINGHAEKVINQHSSALATYSSHNFRDVNNPNTTNHSTNYDGNDDPATLKTKSGSYVNFRHYKDLNGSENSHSPQSLAIASNKDMFVAYNNYNDHMHVVRFHNNQIKEGPIFKGGHGQSMSYNPKNHQLWLIGNKSGGSEHKTCVEEISQATLKPIRKINFTFGQSVISTNLAFDRSGNAYTYTITHGGFAPKFSVKLYKGKITDHSVHFHLIMQGIRHSAGMIPQAMSYNPKTNRLYMVSDGEFVSFPANKIGHLKRRDVHYNKFPDHVEYEGLAFDKSGHGYLLLHPEIMRSTRVFY